MNATHLSGRPFPLPIRTCKVFWIVPHRKRAYIQEPSTLFTGFAKPFLNFLYLWAQNLGCTHLQTTAFGAKFRPLLFGEKTRLVMHT